MKNIFAKFQEYVKKPKRNVFDLTFRNNLTLKFGELAPVFCKEVIPGDSFKIDTQFGLMLMPMKFPVQTPMKAYVHYFYVRNRTTWKDWMDFIGGTKENLVLPYVQPVDKKKFYRVGGLADYLGVPNTLYSDDKIEDDHEITLIGANNSFTKEGADFKYYWSPFVTSLYATYEFLHYPTLLDLNNCIYNDESAILTIDSIAQNAASYLVGTRARGYFSQLDPNRLPNPYNAVLTYNDAEDFDSTNGDTMRATPWQYLASFDKNDVNLSRSLVFNFGFYDEFEYTGNFPHLPCILVYRDSDGVITDVKGTILTGEVVSSEVVVPVVTTPVPLTYLNNVRYSIGGGSLSNYDFINIFPDNAVSVDVLIVPPYVQTFSESPDVAYLSNTLESINYSLSLGSQNTTDVIGDGSYTTTPYDSAIHLNALPFRAYEAIYNSYYRNPQNNPFILNGTPEYNRYVTNLDGGADTTQYDLYFRNWEYDFLTSAVQSPQQGVAPLVGMSITGEATFADEEGNTYYAQAIMNDDGEITGWQSHSSNMPVGSLRLLMDMANTGISINDLRNVNAFQRFLENNIRHGLKYRDQIMSHFGVKVRYDELDMPEFIGGCSAEMEVYKVSQTSNSGDTPLGSFVGQAQVKKQFGHSITHYCDEHGYIIGIMSVVPVPVYSQLLPKHFIKNSQLDYYFPEFGHIGYQPIQQKEVSPLQTFYSAGDLNKVFGYNRGWYDYLASTDEVHSQFRTTMRDFIMNRTFKGEPELGEDFLLVDPDQLNDVFLAGTNDDLYSPEADKIIGSLLFKVSAKRPIPLFGIPKLEG